MKTQILLGLVALFSSGFIIIGLLTFWHVLRSQKYPADKMNRMNKIRLWWFALTKEDKFVGFFPWLRRNEWDNVIKTAPIGTAKDMYTVLYQVLQNYQATFRHDHRDGKIQTIATLDNVEVTLLTSPRLVDETPVAAEYQSDPHYLEPVVYGKDQFKIFLLWTPEEFHKVDPIKDRFKSFSEEFAYLLHQKAVEFRIQKSDHGFNILFETLEDANTRLADHTSGHVFEFVTRWLDQVIRMQSGKNDRDIEHETVQLLAVFYDGLGHPTFTHITNVFPKHTGDAETNRIRFEFSGIMKKLN